MNTHRFVLPVDQPRQWCYAGTKGSWVDFDFADNGLCSAIYVSLGLIGWVIPLRNNELRDRWDKLDAQEESPSEMIIAQPGDVL